MGESGEAKAGFKDEFRTWKSKQGTTLRARYASLGESGKISLETAEGSLREISPDILGEEDLEYLILREEHLEFENELQKATGQVTIDHYFENDDGRTGEIKVTMSRNTPKVEVIVDGRLFTFFVDTGASTSMLSIEAARVLGRNIDSMQLVGRSAGLEGKFLPVYAADFGSLQIGSTTLHDYRLAVYDFENMTENRYSGSPHDGVIGTDLLIQLGAVYHTLENRIRVPIR